MFYKAFRFILRKNIMDFSETSYSVFFMYRRSHSKSEVASEVFRSRLVSTLRTKRISSKRIIGNGTAKRSKTWKILITLMLLTTDEGFVRSPKTIVSGDPSCGYGLPSVGCQILVESACIITSKTHLSKRFRLDNKRRRYRLRL